MKTTLYLIPLDAPADRSAPGLTGMRRRQAELTRDFLAVRSLDHCFCSPGTWVTQTASFLVAPHGLRPRVLDGLLEATKDESTAALQGKVAQIIHDLCTNHPGHTILLIAQEPVARLCLCEVLAEHAPHPQLDPFGISILEHENATTSLRTLNASFHLHGLGSKRGQAPF